MRRYIYHEKMGRPIQGQMCLFLTPFKRNRTVHKQSSVVRVN